MRRTTHPRIPGSVSNLVVLQKVAAMGTLGLDTHRILALAGLPIDRLKDPTGRVANELSFALWEAAIRVSGDAALPLRIGARLEFGALGSYDYLLRNSQSVREMAARADRFIPLMDDHTSIRIVELGDIAALRVQRRDGYPFMPADVECWFAALLSFGRNVYPSFRFQAVHFTHPRPADASPHGRYFGCAVHFSMEHNELLLPAVMIDEPVPQADPKLAGILHEHAEYLLSRLPGEYKFANVARRELFEQLKKGPTDPTKLARALSVSERTLRRRLRVDGTGYQELLSELRLQLARQYVGQTHEGYGAIAQRLGFSDASAFFRAFKRWTGTTPEQFRKRCSR